MKVLMQKLILKLLPFTGKSFSRVPEKMQDWKWLVIWICSNPDNKKTLSKPERAAAGLKLPGKLYQTPGLKVLEPYPSESGTYGSQGRKLHGCANI